MKWVCACFFCKKWTFPQRRVYYFFFGGGGVRTHPTHPLPTGLVLARPTAAKPQAGLCSAAVSYFHII